ncbi:MAG: hypothetical protein JW976_12640 [Syntrophaceae bacterium]|nr:hypothetical protein [Syntrophaceae bacterium]
MTKTDKTGNKAIAAYLEANLGKNILPLPIFEESLPGTNPTEVLLFYKKGTPVSKLVKSIFQTAEHYNLFSSRLIMIDDNKFALQHCKDGAMVEVLPPIDTTFDNLNIDDIRKMMVHVKTLPGEPLFAITGIPINDGILGAISCSHAIGDGIALMLFLYAWGCVIEDKDFPLPSSQRLFKGKPVDFDKIDKTFVPPLSELNDKIQNRVKNASNKETYTIREYFSDEFIQKIKNEAKSENDKYIISSNQIMISVLLKKYHDHILPDTDRIIIRNPVNLRDVHPDIDPLYIGNAHFDSITEFTKDEINKMSIHEIAYRLKESISNSRSESYVKEIVCLSKYGLDFKADFLKSRPPSNMEADILSSNLTHLNDLEAMGLGTNIGSVSYIGLAFYKTAFTMLKEKSGRIFAQITSRYPFT